jgi:HEPN domain-containing protein
MDIASQVEYWKKSSQEDLAAAESLLEKGHLRHSLFFAHLALEKILKAHVTKQTSDLPPRIHNLLRLAEVAQLNLGPEQEAFLREFDIYQLESRYPDLEQIPISPVYVKREVAKAREMIEWLKAQL